MATWVCVAAAGCERQSSEGAPTVVPGDDARGPRADNPEGAAVGDSRDELEIRLEALVREQETVAAAAATDALVCEDLCSLATSICGVREKLCVIADQHPTDDSYAHLCRRAKRQCSDAQEQCIGCVERHSASPASASAPGSEASAAGEPGADSQGGDVPEARDGRASAPGR
jgi:hypothetical protein